MADLMTFEEHRGPVAGQTLAWIGDGNNVCASFIQAAPKFGFQLQHRLPGGLRARPRSTSPAPPTQARSR